MMNHFPHRSEFNVDIQWFPEIMFNNFPTESYFQLCRNMLARRLLIFHKPTLINLTFLYMLNNMIYT